MIAPRTHSKHSNKEGRNRNKVMAHSSNRSSKVGMALSSNRQVIVTSNKAMAASSRVVMAVNNKGNGRLKGTEHSNNGTINSSSLAMVDISSNLAIPLSKVPRPAMLRMIIEEDNSSNNMATNNSSSSSGALLVIHSVLRTQTGLTGSLLDRETVNGSRKLITVGSNRTLQDSPSRWAG